MALGCALAAYPVVNTDDLLALTATLAGLGVVFVSLALFLRPGFVAAALVVLTAEYLITEATGSVSTPSLALSGVGVVVLIELVFWAQQLAVCARVDGSAVTGWLRGIALLAVASGLLAMVALAATGFQTLGALTGTVIGAAAAVVLIAVPWLSVRTCGLRRPR